MKFYRFSHATFSSQSFYGSTDSKNAIIFPVKNIRSYEELLYTERMQTAMVFDQR